MANNGDSKLDVLVDQVGHLTEGMTEFRADMAELKNMIREQNEISKRQAETADRLVKIVETLIGK
jgi:hypothetical protein